MLGNEKTIEILRGVAKKTKSAVAKELVKDNEFADAKCAAAQLFHEAMEEFEEGEMSWKEVVEDLKANLMAIKMPVPPETEEESSEGEDY